MIPHIKLRARALQQRNRALFASVFAVESALFLCACFCGAAAFFFLDGAARAAALIAGAAVLFYVYGGCSAGNARCRAALAGGKSARLSGFTAGFRPKTALCFAASGLFSFALQLILSVLLSLPFGVCLAWLLSCLRRGLPQVSALLFACGTLAAGAATLLCLLRLHALFYWRVFFLRAGAGVFESALLGLRLGRSEAGTLFSLQRSFFGWRLLALLLLPLPFVRGYLSQSRAVLFETTFENLAAAT